MTGLRGFAAAVLTLGLVAMVGCDKKVRLTFVNLTQEGRDVELTAPSGREFAGSVAPNGGKLPFELKIDKKFLPANCTWQARDIGGQLTITDQTPDKLWIDIRPSGPPTVRDKKTEINETKQKEIKDRVIHQDTVVE